MVEWLVLPLILLAGMVAVYFVSLTVHKLYHRQQPVVVESTEESARETQNPSKRQDVAERVDAMPTIVLTSKHLGEMTLARTRVGSEMSAPSSFVLLAGLQETAGGEMEGAVDGKPWQALAGSNKDAADGGEEGQGSGRSFWVLAESDEEVSNGGKEADIGGSVASNGSGSLGEHGMDSTADGRTRISSGEVPCVGDKPSGQTNSYRAVDSSGAYNSTGEVKCGEKRIITEAAASPCDVDSCNCFLEVTRTKCTAVVGTPLEFLDLAEKDGYAPPCCWVAGRDGVDQETG